MDLIKEMAALVAGLQVPLSMGMPLGSADAPLRAILGECKSFGWTNAEEVEEYLREHLAEVVV